MDRRVIALLNALDPMTPTQKEASRRTVADATFQKQALPVIDGAYDALVQPGVDTVDHLSRGEFKEAAVDAAPYLMGAAMGPAAALAGRVMTPLAGAANAVRAIPGGKTAVAGATGARNLAAALAGATGVGMGIDALAADRPQIKNMEGVKDKDAIKAEQRKLRAYGYDGTIDGIWGGGTTEAYQRYVEEGRQQAAAAQAAEQRRLAAEERRKQAEFEARNSPEAKAAAAAKAKALADEKAAGLLDAETRKAAQAAAAAKAAAARETAERQRRDDLLGAARDKVRSADQSTMEAVQDGVVTVAPGLAFAGGATLGAAPSVANATQQKQLRELGQGMMNKDGSLNKATTIERQRGYLDAANEADKRLNQVKRGSRGLYGGLLGAGAFETALGAGKQYFAGADRDAALKRFEDGAGTREQAESYAEAEKDYNRASDLSTAGIYTMIGGTLGKILGAGASSVLAPMTENPLVRALAGEFKENALKAAGKTPAGRVAKSVAKALKADKKAPKLVEKDPVTGRFRSKID